MWHDRNSFYDGKQRYKIVHSDTKEVIEKGFTSQREVSKRISELRVVYGKYKLGIVAYKE